MSRGKDVRMEYVLARLKDLWCMGDKAVEEKLENSMPGQFSDGTENHRHIHAFLQGTGANYLLVLNQPDATSGTEDKIIVVDPAVDIIPPFKKRVMFMQRPETGKAINLRDAQSVIADVQFGSFEPDVLKSFEVLLQDVYTPALQRMTRWGKNSEQEKESFLTNVSRYTENLQEVQTSKSEDTELQLPEEQHISAMMPGASGGKHKSADPKVLPPLTACVEQWIGEIEQVIDSVPQYTEDAQNVPESVGPMSEIDIWRKRNARLMRIVDQLQRKPMQDTLRILRENRQPIMQQRWPELDAHLTEALSETKENVKYLNSLEKYFEIISTQTPRVIMNILPALMSNIKMMYTIARYYSTKERMTTLFIKITNQLIQGCKKTLNPNPSQKNRLWDQCNNTESLHRLLDDLQACLDLSAFYRDEYDRAKSALLVKNPKGKQFDFTTLTIFGRFELFSKRISKLIQVFKTVDQFRALESYNIDGMEQHIARFKEDLANLKGKSNDLLDYTKPSFDKDYIEFTSRMLDLDSSLQVFINSSFENITSTENALAQLKKFQAILQTDSLRSDLDSKYMVIFHNYGLDLENVQKLYDRDRAHPPMVRNITHVAGAITWSKQLFRRIQTPMNIFQSNKTIMNNQKESKKIIRTYNRVAQALLEYEIMYLTVWKNNIENRKAGLNATLLWRQDGRLWVNFDPEIFELMKETRALIRLGIQVPASAKMVLLQEHKLKTYYNELLYLVREYDRLVGRSNEEGKNKISTFTRAIMQPNLDALDAVIRPGEYTLHWTSMNVETYLKQFEAALMKLDAVVQKVNDITANRIYANLKLVSSTLLVNLSENQSFSLEQFVMLQERHIKQQSQIMDIKNKEVETAADDVIRVILASQDAQEVPHDKIVTLKSHYNRMMFKAILTTTTHSLNLIKKRVGTRNRIAFMFVDRPFFDVNVQLSNQPPYVILHPSLEEVQKAINQSATAVLSCSKWMSKWNDMGENYTSFFEEIAKNKEIVKVVLLLTGGIHGLKKQVLEYLNHFTKYEPYWKDDKEAEYQRFLASNPNLDNLEDFEEQLRRFVNLEKEVDSITSTYNIGSLSLNTEPLKKELKREAQEWKNQYAKNLHQQAVHDLDNVVLQMEEDEKQLAQDITENLEDLRLMMNTLRRIRERESEIDLIFKPVQDKYNLLKRYNVTVPKEEFDRVGELRFKWRKLRNTAEKRTDEINQLQHGFKKDLTLAVQKFGADVLTFRNDFVAHGPMVKEIKPDEAMNRLRKYQRLFEDKERKWNTYAAGEELFGLNVNTYPELVRTKKELQLLDQLYSLYTTVDQRVKSYEELLWCELNFDAIIDEVAGFQSQCKRLPRSLREWDAYLELKRLLDNFEELKELVKMLKNDAVKQRHWEAIMAITKTSWRLDADTFKLQNILRANLLAYKDDVEDIALSSVREGDIERKFNDIVSYWKDQELSFAEFKHRGFIILKGDDTQSIKEQLEEASLVVGSMMASRYSAFMRKDVQAMLTKLISVSETIGLWTEVQATWMYLEAVFASGDIMKQLPQEAKRFNLIDKAWTRIMNKANEQRNVLDFCYENELLNGLPGLREQLEDCQRKLSAYLEQKRNLFPRFYFVSDGVLLEILSQASDPASIRKHLCSIFDGVDDVSLVKVKPAKGDTQTQPYMTITELISGEGQAINLRNPVVCVGNVEEWLNSLVDEMCASVREIVKRMAAKVPQLQGNINEINSFIQENPAQVSLLALQLVWTADVTESILATKQRPRQGSQSCQQKILAVKQYLINLTVSPELEKQPKRQRTNVETLITIQVHQEEVFMQTLRRVGDIQSFDWLKQARFYYKSDKDICVVSIADSDTDYSNEYLGVKERLVITPLTDRCYITLSQALAMYMGGAPAGPAGTGKTETTKDLARTFGKMCVVFNCSDQMDRVAMGKIIRGLCQANAWGCFDEFNRIDLPVLSVVAQQVQCVLVALKQHKSEFDFIDGQKTLLQPGVGFFITMNPGYAGRQELPENLKVLFRGVTMMVPDRAAIMKVKLAAQGYQKNDPLSLKFFTLYRLCEEQLSKQRHYDFGLRNILSVLRTAGSVLRKKENIGKDEELLFMRTLRDMNLSKLVFEDIDLFDALLADMFPGRHAEPSRHEEIEPQIESVIKARGIVQWKEWVLKVVQLYETKLVRHGIMVVGPAMCGKSQCYGVMLESLTMAFPTMPHQELRMNPKAITAPQMFGRLEATGDWHDGIFSSLWRKAREMGLREKNKKYVWIICDGPVDAIWIENLNTVLDDNKLLTLANGDRIQMTDTMKCCFEVENLANASPATVSRAGIIYISDLVLGWKPVIEAMFCAVTGDDSKIRPADVLQLCMPALAAKILPIYVSNVGKIELFYQREVVIVMPTSIVHMAVNSFYYVVALGQEIGNAELLTDSLIEKVFWFSVSWSFGGMLEAKDREKFDTFVRQHLKSLPEEGTIFDYKINVKANTWEPWKKFVQPWKYPGDDKLDFSSLFIQTGDTVRMQYLIGSVFQQRHGVMLIGISGTAKTVILEQFLSLVRAQAQQSSGEPQNFKKINFSSATSPQNFYDALDDNLDRQAASYGPKGGGRLTVFIDDINMPEINDWGDQVTNEIVRQVIEFSEMYDLKQPGVRKIIKNVQYVGAMSHPGGGKNDVPNRLKRHMTVINCPLPDQDPIQQIFGSIFEGRFNSSKYSASVVEVASKLTAMTIDFWRQIAKRMLPTPDKFHYFFNLRDLSNVCQGVMLAGMIQDTDRRSRSAPWEVVKDELTLVRLWRHECTRVFSDKLNEGKDKEWFDVNLQECVAKNLSREIADATKEPMYFVSFLREAEIDPETGEAKEPVQKVYEPSVSIEQLQKVLYEFQKDFNATSKVRKLDLVLFDAAVKHVVRLSRILALPRGNALLVGVGGSGKQSLTRLASHVNETDYSQIVVSKNFSIKMFFDAIREQYIAASTKRPVAFVFTDNEIKQEVFLEYINSFLASGEIAGLFGTDERDAAINEMRVVAKKDPYTKGVFQDTADWLWRYFINRVRDRLHFVLCMSPVGIKFRTRARKFPGLISCCYINWFLPWPEKALLSVSERTISAFQMETDPKTKENLQYLMASIHDMMLKRSKEYFERYRRNVYSTPKSYLSFIESYTTVYKMKLDAIMEDATKIGNGLKKLHQAGDDVRVMKGDLQQKEVKLMQAQRETDALVKEIEIRTAEAEKKRAEVEAVKEVLTKEAAIVAAGEAEALKDLEAAQPALESAEKALDSIRPEDLSALKPMQKPPALVKRIFDGVCILLHRPMDGPTYVAEVKGQLWITDSWDKSGKPFISDMTALQQLKTFGKEKKDQINEETCELLLPYLWMEDFTAERARQACGNVAGLCTWVGAMHTYINIAKAVAPKKEKLRKAQADLRIANKKKEVKEAELSAVTEEVARYNAQFDQENTKKQALEDDAMNTKRRMDNANGLIEALSGERERWTQQSNDFKDLIRRLVGDVAMSCAFIAYCGPFNSEFRSMLLNNFFMKKCKDLKIPVTDGLSIVKFLVDDTTVGEWQLEGLPTDDHSVQNAIMITKSSKFPLMVDPQGQGLTWIKNRTEKQMKQKEKEKGELGKVIMCQLNDRHFTNDIVIQMQNGWPMVIENTPEEIDPLMDPILDKQISRNSRTPKVNFNDQECDYNDDFALYLATKLPNPHFIPELYAKCTIIDFTVTMQGLEQQLLGHVIGREKSELNEENAKLAEEINDNEKRRKDLEDRLLKQLSESKGNLIDDLSLIQTLQETKDSSAEIKEKLAIAIETRKRISAACEEYREVAIRGSVLYFLVVEMSLVNSMYQTSLPQFIDLFDESIMKSERAQVTAKRIHHIIEHMTFNVFGYIVRGLFAKHKLLFVLLMSCKIQMRSGKLPGIAFQTFLKGGAGIASDKAKPFSWFKDKPWLNCVGLTETVPRAFKQLLDYIQRGEKVWRDWIEADSPEAEVVPDLNEKLEPFDRLLLVRAVREDRTLLAASDYVSATLGRAYSEPQQLDMDRVVEETNGITPIIFILSQGSDPTATIETASKKIKKKVHPVSMGQGQEDAANDCVEHAFRSGDWALLQNCHLGLPFLTMLEEKLRVTTADMVHEEARIWITSEPHNKFPIGLLQVSIKLTNEPPVGIKAGIIRSYSWLSQDIFDTFRRPEWKPLIFTQCFLHSIVQERRKFGPSGFCIPYEFNQGDWMASLQFLQNHLTLIGEDTKKYSVSWETLRYMIADIQYGGRITDNKDRELFSTITTQLFDSRITHVDKDRGYVFCRNPPSSPMQYCYAIPLGDDIIKHRDFIRETFPEVDPPDVFGMNPNADITYRTLQTQEVLSTILDVQPRGSGDTGEVSRDQIIKNMCDNFLKQLPPKWKPDKKEKLGDRQPLSIFAGQEIDRLSVVVKVIRTSCIDLQDAMAGKIIMSPVLQDCQDYLFDARVPPSWVKVAWPAPSITGWFSEVLRRLEQLDSWAKSGRPSVYWLAGFFNPQGFLTSVRQEITRGHKADNWALDKVETRTEVMKFERSELPDRMPETHEKGAVYVYGMYLEGASWDKGKQNNPGKLKEALPGDLYKELPVLQVYAASTDAARERRQDPDAGGRQKKMNKYRCAVYKYKQRTDNHWIFDVDLNCEEEPWHWKLRGTSLLCNIE